MIRVLFLIRSLGGGGAERQLALLAAKLDRRRFSPTVATFYPGGLLRPGLEQAGVPVVSFDKAGRLEFLSFLGRAVSFARRLKPHIIHGYMPVGNQIALLMGKAVGAKVVWGVRESVFDFRHFEPMVGVTWRASTLAARFADLVIANSQAGATHHVRHGYPADRMRVIPNGIDTVTFSPHPEDRDASRDAFGLPSDAAVVGLVGRVDPLKDHESLIRAAREILPRHPNARFLCVGTRIEPLATQLSTLATKLGVEHALVWSPPSVDIVRAYAAMDLLVSSSISEGFSNVLVEAMACGVPVVATDVGDSASIVDDSSRVTPPRAPTKLAAAITRLLDLSPLERGAVGARDRERVSNNFGVRRMVDSTEAALVEVLG